MARKPLVGTVAANVLQHGTGALNIDGTRIGTTDNLNGGAYSDNRPMSTNQVYGEYRRLTPGEYQQPEGRWPANVVLDEAAAEMLDQMSGERKSPATYVRSVAVDNWGVADKHMRGDKAGDIQPGYGDTGGASRFFYVAKASRRERNAGLDGMPERAAHLLSEAAISTASNRRCRTCGRVKFGQPHCECAEPDWEETTGSKGQNHHPTVKPVALMRWLVRLVTPPGGLILDPFAGSGSTGCAAVLEGFRFVGIEQDAEYAAIAERRITYWAAQRPTVLQPALPLEGAAD